MDPLRTWIIGADPSCDIVLDVPTVSGRHCRVTQTAEGFALEDLGSSNGTFVKGERIAGPVVVTKDDEITLGRAVRMPWPDEAASPEAKTIRIGRSAENPR